MNGMTLWLTLIAMGLVTYAIRLSLIVAIGRFNLPPLVQRSLRYVPPAVLSAIIFPELFAPGGVYVTTPLSPRLLAGLIAALFAWRTRHAVWTIAAGMAAFWALQALIR